MRKATDLERSHATVLKILQRADVGSVLQRVGEAGSVPEFLVVLPNGMRIAVEVRVWPSRDGNVARAWDQVSLIRENSVADAVLIVIPNLNRNYPNKGVVSIEGLQDALVILAQELNRDFPTDEKRLPIEKTDTHGQPMVFVAMPFKREFDAVFFTAIDTAVRNVGAVCERIDMIEFSGDILTEIKRRISACSAVVADVSQGNPNVLYELGFAYA